MSEKHADRLANYVEVHERISAFREKHPDGSLQGSWTLETLNDQSVIVYCAKAYRQPDDKRPGIGYASEPVPGRTPYTKDSELMNAETSAWGRALAALGFEVHRGIASANEVRARSNGEASEPRPASKKQLSFLDRLMKDKDVKDPGAVISWRSAGHPFLPVDAASQLIDALQEDKDVEGALKAAADKDDEHAKRALGLVPEVPFDDADLQPALEADPGPDA